MKEVPLAEFDVVRHLRDAEEEAVVITRHGLPAGVLIGFKSVAEWIEYRREHDPELRRLVEKAAGLLAPSRTP